MNKSKALSVIDHDPRAAKVREYHHIAMNAANQAVAAAIFAGLELRAIQADLKATDTGVSFEDWMNLHRDELSFTSRTGFRYTALADKIKNKLLAKRDGSLDRLLSLAPSQMNGAQAKLLLETLHKSVDGVALTDLYEDFGIVKKSKHGHGLLKLHDKSHAGATPAPTPEGLIQGDLWLPIAGGGDGTVKTIWQGIDDLFIAWNKKLKVGAMTQPLWQHAEKKKLAGMVKELRKRKDIAVEKIDKMIAQAEEALGT